VLEQSNHADGCCTGCKEQSNVPPKSCLETVLMTAGPPDSLEKEIRTPRWPTSRAPRQAHARRHPSPVPHLYVWLRMAYVRPESGPAVNRNDRSFVGYAQRVCLNPATPAICPLDATLYSLSPGQGWRADLTAIPGATWIWTPGVDGNSLGAELAGAYFSKTLFLRSRANAGIMYVAVDDYAEVFVNQQLTGSIGSITDIDRAGAAQGELASFDISDHLKPGRNVITVHAQNGFVDFSEACDNTCTYQENPAGVVFGGQISSSRARPGTKR
jgi:hypothetical protein